MLKVVSCRRVGGGAEGGWLGYERYEIVMVLVEQERVHGARV